ncbi:MAG: hypothetical protein EZS28_012406 [Streblomastix strix]|uniref:Right handed beta helix domain-containing protein n=1 Tax=Streblomastix strix TaxID=222440 RepID=A0A5J4WAR7_9EUKA|nr:MAG: hypothetical protein EZS28_012406 [Streblomastix strix]
MKVAPHLTVIMFVILALASLSLGFQLDFGKIDSATHGNTTVNDSKPIYGSDHLVSKSQQFISLEKDSSKLHSAQTGKLLQKPTNDECSLTVGTGGDYITVAAALVIPCESSGYKITLLEETHVENLVIDIESTILIKGANSEGPYTQWTSNKDGENSYLIELKNGYLIIQFVDFQFVQTTHFSTPTNGLIYARSTSQPYPSITIEYCNFRGLGNEQGSQQTNTMIEISGGYSLVVDECTFSSTKSQNAVIKAVDYIQFSVSNSNFTDINGGSTGAIEVYTGTGTEWDILIQGNIFDNCVGTKYGAINVDTGSATTTRYLQIIDNQIKNCAGSNTGGIYINYAEFGAFVLQTNIFQDNSIISSQSYFGCDAHIVKASKAGVSDPVYYYKDKTQGSKSNQLKSVFVEILEGSNQANFSLRTISNQCWDASIEPEYFADCICTAQGHYNIDDMRSCVCPSNDPDYQQDKCDFYKLPTCSGDSDPDKCRCDGTNYPSYCLCPLDDLDTTYTKTQCELEKGEEIPPDKCTGIDDEPNCICTLDNHPTDCTCPDDDADYSPAQCQEDKQEVIPPVMCTGIDDKPDCICTLDNHPTDCTCPIDYHDYSQAQCLEDKYPVTPDKCDPITATTPEVDCACPTDAAKLELDPRKETICKPSTGKESSGSIRAVLYMIVAIVLIPALALIF